MNFFKKKYFKKKKNSAKFLLLKVQRKTMRHKNQSQAIKKAYAKMMNIDKSQELIFTPPFKLEQKILFQLKRIFFLKKHYLKIFLHKKIL
ncbi:unnamed protein product [Blepharisma stoltei]|uniref:Uncharacterized protein n=1 Tax=Blepharisma stoltei TaxID=1481888 RepID=A0AAU9I5C1_9CILI|nr:unnamed protein product [Blepharisma stoltei]